MAVTFQSLIQADATREQIEEWCRGRTQSYGVGVGNAVVCRVLGKYIMYCHGHDSALTPHLALNGIWEPWVTMAIARHLKPGMRCMDVGACYGYYSLLMKDIVGDQGYVEAWEPVWGAHVKHNAAVNGLGLYIIVAAMSSNEGRLLVNYPQRGSLFNAGDVPLVRTSKTVGSVVQARPPADQKFDFIKIDVVEGAEADVWEALRGAREMSPALTVCMGFTPPEHADPEGFLRRIMDDGFELGTVGHDGFPRSIAPVDALLPNTGDFRMLWLTRSA